MIKRQLFWWVILAILIVVGLTMLGDQHGHVMIVRHPYRIQLSFNLLLVLMVLGLLIFYYLMRVFGMVKRMPANWKTQKNIKNLSQQQALLVQSIKAMAGSEPEKAQKLLKKVNKQVDSASIAEVISDLEQQSQAVKQIEKK